MRDGFLWSKLGVQLSRWCFYGLLLVVFVGPFWAFAMTAFSGVTLQPGELVFWPKSPTLANFHYAWFKTRVWRFLLNSMLIVTFGLILQVSISSLAAYALARKKFVGSALVSMLILSTMMLPEEVIAIPLYLVLGNIPLFKVSLLNTHLGMILPLIGWAFSIFMLTEFMKKVPLELEEAARMDGANELQIFWMVILPLIKPALGTVTVFGFIMIWDQYLLPLIVANREDLYTLPVALASVRADEAMPPAVFVAITLIAMLPSIFIYLAMQKAFNRGLLAGAVKG